MPKRKTHEEFVEELKYIHPNLEVIGTYVTTHKDIKLRCIIHDYEFLAMPSNLLRGHGCKKCGSEKQSKSQTKTTKQFIEDLYNVNPNIEVIGDYVSCDVPIKLKCKIDNYIWDAIPSKVLSGQLCPVCTHHKVMVGVNDISTTHPELAIYFKDKNDMIHYSYGSTHVSTFVCPKCGNERDMPIIDFVRGGMACSMCFEIKNGRQRAACGYWSMDTIQQYLDQHKPGYRVLDTVVGNNKRSVYIQCDNKKHEPYWADWQSVLSGCSCMQCFIENPVSRGESMTISIPNNNLINFIPQKIYDDCRDIRPLPFDFYLPEYNLIIEIMGIQHKEPIDFFGGEEGFSKRIFHDKIKRDYLKSNNIECLDIWYYEFDKMEELILNKIQSIITAQN